MIPKIYIIIAMILVLLLLIYHTNIFKINRELFESEKNITKPNFINIDDLDIKQLKNIVKEQHDIINEQKNTINEYINKIKKNNSKFEILETKPNEEIEKYFEKSRKINDDILDMNLKKTDTNLNEDILEQNKKSLNIIKRYLEDPVMRGHNIYESEQYSKLMEIGNIQVDNPETVPKPLFWSKNINKQ